MRRGPRPSPQVDRSWYSHKSQDGKAYGGAARPPEPAVHWPVVRVPAWRRGPTALRPPPRRAGDDEEWARGPAAQEWRRWGPSPAALGRGSTLSIEPKTRRPGHRRARYRHSHGQSRPVNTAPEPPSSSPRRSTGTAPATLLDHPQTPTDPAPMLGGCRARAPTPAFRSAATSFARPLPRGGAPVGHGAAPTGGLTLTRRRAVNGAASKCAGLAGTNGA